jgi:hypothetical protein
MEIVYEWLTGDNIPRPDFAEPFMTTLHLLYMNKSDPSVVRRLRRRRSFSGGALLSLKAICFDSDKESGAGVPASLPAAKSSVETAEKDKTPDAVETWNSLDLAEAVAGVHATISSTLDKPHSMTMSLLQSVLYMIYGIFLSDKKVRIIDEPPQMWRYGAVFARVYSKSKLDFGATSGAAMRLREKDPALYSLTAGVIHSCIDRGMKRTTDILYGEGSPWGSCHRRNPDKWGIPLDDGEIASWFSRHPDIWR